MLFKIEYLGGVTSDVSGGKYVSFFGQEITDKQALYRCSIIAMYSGGAWNVHVVPSMGLYQTFGTIPGYCIEDGTLFATAFPDDKLTSQKLNVASMAGYITPAMLSTSAATELLIVDVSFESGELGDFKIKIPYACTVLEFYSYAIKAVAGTDNGTITPKNNAGTTMTSGVITYTASDARGTAYTSTPSANNTFSAGDFLTLTTAKTTAGGKIQMSIKIQRT